MMNFNNIIKKTFDENVELTKNSVHLVHEIDDVIKIIIQTIKKGKKVIIFGNGGSATDAQHISGELIGRFNLERKPFPVISLTADTAILTAISNDYSFAEVFSRQCEGLVMKGDAVIGISTSGNSENVKNGLIISKKKGANTIGLLGNNGGKIKNVVKIPIIVQSSSTPRIQEIHRLIYHIICDVVEKELSKKNGQKNKK
jgi:D-sedoheptulose 7-phosphate isomerase